MNDEKKPFPITLVAVAIAITLLLLVLAINWFLQIKGGQLAPPPPVVEVEDQTVDPVPEAPEPEETNGDTSTTN